MSNSPVFARVHVWVGGEVLFASDLNTEFNNIINNTIPQDLGAYSGTVLQMQSAVSPGTVGGESLASALSGELERLRFTIRELKQSLQSTIAQWYQKLSGTIDAVLTFTANNIFSGANTFSGIATFTANPVFNAAAIPGNAIAKDAGITQTNLAASSVGTGQLKTATGSATSGGSALINVSMNDYSFFPSITADATGGAGLFAVYTANPGNTVGRFQILAAAGASGVSTANWRYLTASDDPTVWAAYDPVSGEIKGLWWSDDPLPGNEPGVTSPGCISADIPRADLGILLPFCSAQCKLIGLQNASSPDRIPFRTLEKEFKNPGLEIINRCKMDVVTQKLVLK